MPGLLERIASRLDALENQHVELANPLQEVEEEGEGMSCSSRRDLEQNFGGYPAYSARSIAEARRNLTGAGCRRRRRLADFRSGLRLQRGRLGFTSPVEEEIPRFKRVAEVAASHQVKNYI